MDWQSGSTACCLHILTLLREKRIADVPSVMDLGKGADVPSHDGAPAKENRLGCSQSLFGPPLRLLKVQTGVPLSYGSVQHRLIIIVWNLTWSPDKTFCRR